MTIQAVEIAQHDCPLCGHIWKGEEGCPSSCPMARGCGLVRCPNCRYEFVEKSRLVGLAQRFGEKLRAWRSERSTR